MRLCAWSCRVRIVLLAIAPAVSSAAELPAVTVDLATGRKLRAVLDSRTSEHQLWLRFGNTQTVVQRGFDWRSVIEVREGTRTIESSELVQLAKAARQPDDASTQRRVVVRSSASPSDLPQPAVLRTPVHLTRVASVTFDATLANWDADVMTDGLYITVAALDPQGQPVSVRGTLTAELFSMKRVDQDEIPHGRGRDLRRMERWSTQIDFQPDDVNSGLVRLPFQTPYPEFDIDWAPFGLVHIQLVVPGQGVFDHSIDGLRIRPWAPLRDALELQTGRRYFPSENQ